jgi:transcriptional regulator with XRE-family HTH domain
MMEKYVDMKSPFTGGRVKEVFTTEEQEFRKENYTVHARYYVCEDTGEKFTTTEQDELAFNELYGQYRVRHGIPFPEDIKATRERYSLSLAAISKILGFGINQYANYENGQVPSESNGKMILAARNKNFMVSLLDSSREQFTEAEFTKIRNSILSAPEESTSDKLTALYYSDTQCSVYNGFSSLNTNKVANMAKFFIHKEGSVFPTKLNKEMFYADFAHYRKHGRSISGLRYKAIKYGPVPYHYDTIYDNIDGVEKNIVISHNSESTCLACDGYDPKSFSEDELATLESVFAVTQKLTTEEIVDKSHEEPAWANYNSQSGFIPYSEAFNLILL